MSVAKRKSSADDRAEAKRKIIGRSPDAIAVGIE
jgi:hypothetical protein